MRCGSNDREVICRPLNSVRGIHMKNELHTYEVEDTELGFGASLGNGHTWVETGSDGRIHSFFAADVGEEVAGAVMMRYGSAETRVTQCRGESCELAGKVPLEEAGSATFTFHPAWQVRSFDLPGGLRASETICVPKVAAETAGDQCAVYLRIELVNESDAVRQVSVSCQVRLAGRRRSPCITGEYDEKRRALFARERDKSDWVRTLAATRQPSGHALTTDFGALYDTDVDRKSVV